jgi:hypothetical protein
VEDYYEYLDSNGVTTLYKLIKDDTVALINGYSVTLNNITTNLDNHVNNTDIHTPISTIENMIDTRVSGLVNSAPETLDTLKELSDALGNDPNFATTVANQIGTKADKDSVYAKQETDTLLESKANSVHNHVVSDITDMPTIPTKTSQLINDSGFLTSSSGVITSVSWSDITNKPNFSTVATSGSYTDLSNTPTIPTKVSQLENDTGFVSGLTDVVDTKSNQTINGTKTFTSGPWVINSQTTMGFSIKNTALARNDVPSEYQHYTFRAYDKNSKTMGEYCIEKATTGDALLNMNVRSEDASGTQISYGMQFRMTNDGSLVRFFPSANNKVHLGDTGAKWASVHATNAYIDKVTCTRFTHSVNNGSVYITGGSEYDKGATLVLNGEDSSGDFIINARDKTRSLYLVGKPDGTLQWAGQNIALDGNLVHKTGDETIAGNKTFSNRISFPSGYFISTDPNDNSLRISRSGSNHGNNYKVIIQGDTGKFFAPNGFIGNLQGNADTATSANDPNAVHKTGNETIKGVKYFDSLVYLHNNMSNKNSQMDLFTTPTSTLYSHYMFVDKNNEVSAYMQYGQQYTGTDFIGLFIHDKNKALHGIQVTTNNYVIPLTNNAYSLGASSNQWANVYATRINCDNIIRTVENSYIYMTAGPAWNNGASIFLNGKSGDGLGTGKGTFLLFARDGTNERRLLGYPNGILSWNGCIESHEVRSTTVNGFMAQYGSYTFLIRNDGSNTYFLMSDKDGTPGTWSTARPLIINNATGVCSINGHADSATHATTADSATYATTQATSDNSTKIATTAWVRAYVDSVAGSNTVGSSVSAYWSNSSLVTATGQSSSGGYYPECYSEYVSKTPVVGTIYSGAQLYTVLNTYASATGSKNNNNSIYVTNNKAQATLSNPLSSAAKYLCTTANTFSFRAYTASGNTSSVGASSVVNATLTKSIFIRVQ